MNETTDVAIIGAGPAGLQAALTIGRMHRTAIVLDSGSYRNDPADAMHNLIAHDGQSPADLRAAARADLDRYDTVRVVDAAVDRVDGELGRFRLTTDAGEFVAGRVILATGMRDTLPDIPEIGSVFGAAVAHCPFCHGHEYAGKPVALIGPAPFLEHMSALMSPIASSLTAFPNGTELDDGVAERLELLGVEIISDPVHGFHRRADGVDIVIDDGAAAHGRPGHGSLARFGGALVRLESAPAAPHADQLGLEVSEMGGVIVDPFGRTSAAGIYAAGDIAQQPNMPGPMWAVWSAIATGAAAGTGAVQDLAGELLGRVAACQRPVGAPV
ncbi:NAD(P)/FAD-dependent oxidoreductase [Microbacterium karelineae]|uniref:NAD(P)/FAD-dependent oxidoreductase n=1 Tax=Microbacterium karelineae TaxID=2654283 RepID=UPI0012E9D756|nr:NAD(P)/FAD-dependent oxidoreductase [Microbacterium karelineae]